MVLGWGRSAGGRARGVLRVWALVDRVESRRTRLTAVHAGGVIAYSLRRHRGRPVRLADGTVVSRGDLVLEIHLHNEGMLRAAGESPWRRLERARADLRLLAAAVAEGRLGAVQVLHGTTLLGAAGRRAGFELHPLPITWRWRLERFFLLGMDAIHHPDGTRRLGRSGAGRWPAELWMSRQRFIDLYVDSNSPRSTHK